MSVCTKQAYWERHQACICIKKRSATISATKINMLVKGKVNKQTTQTN